MKWPFHKFLETIVVALSMLKALNTCGTVVVLKLKLKSGSAQAFL